MVANEINSTRYTYLYLYGFGNLGYLPYFIDTLLKSTGLMFVLS